jgi:hypothetical protein
MLRLVSSSLRLSRPGLLAARAIGSKAKSQKRVVVVTGGAKGIGFGITESFLFSELGGEMGSEQTVLILPCLPFRWR